MKNSIFSRRVERGFSLIEILVVVAIMGLFLAVSYPSIRNTMAVRNLENTTRQVQTFLQQAKLQAVSTRTPHRVRFTQDFGAYWSYDIERLQPDGTWDKALSAPPKAIPSRVNVTLNIPAAGADFAVVFSAVGTVANFAAGQNSITLTDPNLTARQQMDQRIISFFLGGSIQYARNRST